MFGFWFCCFIMKKGGFEGLFCFDFYGIVWFRSCCDIVCYWWSWVLWLLIVWLLLGCDWLFCIVIVDWVGSVVLVWDLCLWFGWDIDVVWFCWLVSYFRLLCLWYWLRFCFFWGWLGLWVGFWCWLEGWFWLCVFELGLWWWIWWGEWVGCWLMVLCLFLLLVYCFFCCCLLLFYIIFRLVWVII